ncbi:MAG: YeeE/YedE family protein, partial [Halobacteriovoraceae bacterium]|nr:YeeE/YedE family protein [Halobacteriovoraceae bacterium]
MNLLTKANYLKPYIAGIGLGFVLLAAFYVSGSGLGASGAMMRTVVTVEKVISQSHVDNNIYLANYGGGDKNPMDAWLVFEVIGVLIGGLFSGILGGRIKVETNHGPRINKKRRLYFAFAGGALFGAGARIARGCTSGIALSGGATLALGSWITMMCIFIG